MKSLTKIVALAISAMLLMNSAVYAQDHWPRSTRHSHSKQRTAPPQAPRSRIHKTPRQHYTPAPPYPHYYKPGYRTRPLPHGASRIVVDRSNYYFYDGFYYQPFQSGYVIVDAPIGAIIATLPRLHHQVMWGGSPYFVVDNKFYRRHPRGYIVVNNPGIVLWR